MGQDSPAFVDLRYLTVIHSPAFGDVASECMMEVFALEVHGLSRNHGTYTNLFLSDNRTIHVSGYCTSSNNDSKSHLAFLAKHVRHSRREQKKIPKCMLALAGS
jgi:hypothetical protein